MSASKIMFYHATETSVIAVLFELLKKSLQARKRCLVVFDTLENASHISSRLWKFQEDFIMPHGLITEEFPEKQLILLSDNTKNINNSDYIFFIGRMNVTDFNHFERSIVIFDNSCDITKDHIRQEFKQLRLANHEVTYYQQHQNLWISK